MLKILLKNYWTAELEMRANDNRLEEIYHDDVKQLAFLWKKNIYSQFSLQYELLKL